MTPMPTEYLVDRPIVQRELYALSTIVFSGKRLHEFSDGTDLDEFDKLRLRHEVNEATRLTISLAVIVRNIVDYPERIVDPIQQIRRVRRQTIVVGALSTGVRTTDLSLRQACNKIVHGETFHFDMKKDVSDGRMPYMTGKLTVKGKRDGKAWTAEIEMEAFIRMAFRVTT